MLERKLISTNLSNPNTSILTIGNKPKKRKYRTFNPPFPPHKQKKSTTTSSINQSLSMTLKGKVLDPSQIKKKELLEKFVSIPSGEETMISQYLHEKGFSYESQASMVSVKGVNTYMINYLVAIFFKKSENPLKNESLDNDVLKKISCKWDAIKNILESTNLSITAEHAVLSLLKKEGVAYESLIIFLNLFEKNEWRDYDYPLGREKLINTVLEVARGGGHVGLESFLETFKNPFFEKKSEWEIINDCFWEALEDVAWKRASLVGYIVRYDRSDWVIVSDKVSKFVERQLLLENHKNTDAKKIIILNNTTKMVSVLNESMCLNRLEKEDCFVKDPYLSDEVILNHLIQCSKKPGGSKNKTAFVSCFKRTQQDSLDEFVLYHFLRSKKGGEMGVSEALQAIVACVSQHGGMQNKLALIRCLRTPEVNLNGKMVTLYDFLCSEKGGGFSVSEAVRIIVKCMSHNGGSQNQQAFIDCLNKPLIDLNGVCVSLYTFMISTLGGRFKPSEALQYLARCIGHDGGSQNQQALIACFNELEVNLNGKNVSLYHFFRSEYGVGLNDYEAIKILFKCISHNGGSKNKQALVDCFKPQGIDLCGQTVSFFTFLRSEYGGALSPMEALHVIIKCIAHIGGSKSLEALISCLSVPEIDVDGKNRLSFLNFLQSEQGGGLSTSEALQVIIICLAQIGGAKNKQALLECFCKPEVDIDGEKKPLYTFLQYKRGGRFSASIALKIIIKCIGQHGGSKNKQALLMCLNKPEIQLDGRDVTFLNFLQSPRGGGLRTSEAILTIAKCIGHDGGSKNKQALLICLTKPEMNLGGKKVSIYEYLQDESGGGLSAFEALQIIIKCVNCDGGSQNKQALMDCFLKHEITLDGHKVPLYTFLQSERGCGYSASEALLLIVKCIRHGGGSQNKQVLMNCIEMKMSLRSDCFQTLFDTFLSVEMTRKEAFSLCLFFAVNRYELNIQDIFQLFTLRKEVRCSKTVMDILRDIDISCYSTILNLAVKKMKHSHRSAESKRKLFSESCHLLRAVFLDFDGFYVRKSMENPDWSTTVLGEMCIDACALYSGEEINKELQERERVVVAYMRPFIQDYQLTRRGLDVIAHVQNIAELKDLIELSRCAINRRPFTYVDMDNYEESLNDCLQILLGSDDSTVRSLIKYESILLKWFDLKTLAHHILNWSHTKIDRSIYYFFSNITEFQFLLPNIDLKKRFMLYMGLSVISPLAWTPLNITRINEFIGIIRGKDLSQVLTNPYDCLYPLYSIYSALHLEGLRQFFEVVINGVPKVFGSLAIFKKKYLKNIRKMDWEILISLLGKWDLLKDNLSQDEFSFLVRIRYRFPNQVFLRWSELSRLESCSVGCEVVNLTSYPNWVFAIAFLNQIFDLLASECLVIKQQGIVVFESYNDIDIKKYKFPLFNIQLSEKGVLFVGESVNSVECFYELSGLADRVNLTDDCHNESPETIDRGGKETQVNASNQALPKKDKRIRMFVDSVELATRLRSRRVDRPSAHLLATKQIKSLTRQEVVNLFRTVARRDFLTEKNCELLMKGGDYLSDEMMTVLSTKMPAVEICSEEIRLKWHTFIKRYQDNKFQGNAKSLNKRVLMQCESDPKVFASNDIDASLNTPITDFDDRDETFNHLDGSDFEDVLDFWIKDFASEMECQLTGGLV